MTANRNPSSREQAWLRVGAAVQSPALQCRVARETTCSRALVQNKCSGHVSQTQYNVSSWCLLINSQTYFSSVMKLLLTRQTSWSTVQERDTGNTALRTYILLCYLQDEWKTGTYAKKNADLNYIMHLYIQSPCWGGGEAGPKPLA
jgi:hypothetical protein